MRWIRFRLSPLAARHSTLFTRFLKFCLVGGSGVLVDMGVLFLLADPRMLALNITISKICAAEIALINNFIWNELWTFRTSSTAQVCPRGVRIKFVTTIRKRDSLFYRFVLFNLICGIGIGIAVILLNLFHYRLGWNLYASNFFVVAIVTMWNFYINLIANWKTSED